MRENASRLLNLDQIKEKYPAQDYSWRTEQKGEIIGVSYRAHKDSEGRILYVVPHSIRRIDPASS